MVVWKGHGIEPPPEEVVAMERALAAAGDERFGVDNWSMDGNMRQIPTHFHAHARDKDWFALRGQRPMSRYTGVGTERVERS